MVELWSGRPRRIVKIADESSESPTNRQNPPTNRQNRRRIVKLDHKLTTTGPQLDHNFTTTFFQKTLWSSCGRIVVEATPHVCCTHVCVCVCVCVRVAHNLTHPDRDAQQTHKTSSPAACTSWRPPWPPSRRGKPAQTPRTPKSQTRPMFLSIRHSKHVLAGLNSRLRFKLSQSNLAQLTPQPSF